MSAKQVMPEASTVNGSRLLEALGYNRHLAGALIATRNDWQELLDSIPSGPSRRNVAIVVFEIRQALGLEANHALDICQGRE